MKIENSITLAAFNQLKILQEGQRTQFQQTESCLLDPVYLIIRAEPAPKGFVMLVSRRNYDIQPMRLTLSLQ